MVFLDSHPSLSPSIIFGVFLRGELEREESVGPRAFAILEWVFGELFLD